MQKPIEGVVIGCCVNQNLAGKPKKRLTKPTEAYQPRTAAYIKRGGVDTREQQFPKTRKSSVAYRIESQPENQYQPRCWQNKFKITVLVLYQQHTSKKGNVPA